MIGYKNCIVLFIFLMLGNVKVYSLRWYDQFQVKIKQEPPVWMMRQIKNDLSSFASRGITRKQLDTVIERHQENPSSQIVRYLIKDGVLRIKYVGGPTNNNRLKYLSHHLSVLAQAVNLPNVDFIVSLEDEADDFHRNYDTHAPLLAFAKNVKSNFVILIPDAITLRMCKKLEKEAKRGSRLYPWNKKKSQIFWRGASTGGTTVTEKNFMEIPRIQLTALSLLHPSFINSRLTLLCQMSKKMEKNLKKNGFMGQRVPIWEHMGYKYQMLIDGNSSAYERAYWQLFSNSVIFKQKSPNIQWYYNELQPYEHFIPVKNNVSDLIDQIKWARKNEKKVKKIIRNANAFIENNLRYEDMLLYIYLLLCEYAKIQQF